MAKRIQRKRTKGWKMPPNTVSVTRPSDFGNPFKVGGWYIKGDPAGASLNPRLGLFKMIYAQSCIGGQPNYTQIKTAAEAVDWFRWYCSVSPPSKDKIEKLRGKNLACFCPLDQPCHADVLLEIANADGHQQSSNYGTNPTWPGAWPGDD